MPEREYDLIVVGGGLAGAAFAKSMAEHGARVLVCERETQFRDRVRGETTGPWGVTELRALGLDQLILQRCAREVWWFDTYLGGAKVAHRDLRAMPPLHLPCINWVHCEMEEVLLRRASEAGAEVRRGAHVSALRPGATPTVSIEESSGTCDLRARLIVGADGRSSNVRKWANFPVQRDDYGLLVAGILMEMPAVDPDTNCFVINSANCSGVFIAPQNLGRVRAYVGIPRDSSRRFQGLSDLARFVQDSVAAGAPSDWYSDIRPIGPLATFDGADTWVDHPYKDGVVLIGDAASSNDPSYGQGQALSLRDARVLRDHLIATDDWNAAAHAYAEAHDSYYGALHRFTAWFWQLFLETGSQADARRARALPLLAQDPARMPDVLLNGPDRRLDEKVRRRFFGEA